MDLKKDEENDTQSKELGLRTKRKKAKRACFACQRAHLTCGIFVFLRTKNCVVPNCFSSCLYKHLLIDFTIGDERPCQRCIKRGLASACQDGVRKKAKLKLVPERNNGPPTTSTLASDTLPVGGFFNGESIDSMWVDQHQAMIPRNESINHGHSIVGNSAAVTETGNLLKEMTTVDSMRTDPLQAMEPKNGNSSAVTSSNYISNGCFPAGNYAFPEAEVLDGSLDSMDSINTDKYTPAFVLAVSIC
jgi:hypothetical protein